jgi:hypothetical protein
MPVPGIEAGEKIVNGMKGTVGGGPLQVIMEPMALVSIGGFPPCGENKGRRRLPTDSAPLAVGEQFPKSVPWLRLRTHATVTRGVID